MNICFLGSPASGKGTQASLLAKELGLPHISTGSIFRENIEQNTELGKIVKQYLDTGSLVPDEITNKMVAERLKETDTKKGFILDGYPRTLAQSEFLNDIVKIDKAIEIRISDEEAINRIKSRRSCACGKTYNLNYNPPKVEIVCDKCEGELFIRDDDKPKAVKERLVIYHAEINPLLDYYNQKGILEVVNGEQAIIDINKEIMKKIK